MPASPPTPPVGDPDPEPEPEPEHDASEYEDQTATCAKCGKEFVVTASEQAFYASKGFAGRPGRCPECRASLSLGQAAAPGAAGSAPQPAKPPQPSLAGQIKEKIALLKKGGEPPTPGGHFDKFTERAKHVMQLAQREADRLNHNYIGTEHILLGLVAEREGIAAKILEHRGVELNKVRSGVEFIIGRGDKKVAGERKLTPRTKKVIELAIDEARRLNHNYIGTEHLLLGLIREGEGIAAGVLESLGVDMAKTRQNVIDVVSQSRVMGGKSAVGTLPEAGPSKDNVITCRIPSGDLEAIDALIEAGIRSTRSDAASWLIHAGIQANLDLFDKVYSTVAEIRRLREQAQSAAKDLESRERGEKPDKPSAVGSPESGDTDETGDASEPPDAPDTTTPPTQP